VATGLDDNYVFQFLVMAYSAQINRHKDFNLKIAFGNGLLSEKNRIMISEVLEILEISYEFISVNLDSRLRSEKWIAVTSFIRLYLADSLAENFLWLDGDLLCLKGWDKIFDDYEHSIKKNAICAAVDTIPLLNLTLRNPYKRNSAILRMGQDYFNAGVLLVNPTLWRAINKENPWKELYDHYNEMGFQFADQCIINYLCSNSFQHLDKSYNVFASIRKKYDSSGGRKILHFAGAEKPWFYKKFNFAMLSSNLGTKDILKYIEFQTQIIKIVNRKDSELGKSLRTMQKILQKDIPNVQTWHHEIYHLKRKLRIRYTKSYVFQRYYLLDRLIWFKYMKKNKPKVKEPSNQITAITVSVNYSEVLAYIIEKNIHLFSSWIIVTDSKDERTIALVQKYPKIELLFFDFTEHGRKFNKGGGIRLAQEFVYRKYPDHWYLILDSDICLQFASELALLNHLDDQLIYLCGDRRDYHSMSTLLKQESYMPYDGPIESGFFQLYREKSFYKDSMDAGWCDIWFIQNFPSLKVLPDLVCDHLGMAENWDGSKGVRFRFD